MTTRSISLTGVQEWTDAGVRQQEDYLAAEEPLEITVSGNPITVTMRTPDDDCELAAGFLYSEGLISSRAEIASIQRDQGLEATARNRILVELTPETTLDLSRVQRNFYATSSCGVCGRRFIEGIHARHIGPLNAACEAVPEILCKLPEQLRSAQKLFERTGSLHAAGLFTVEGEFLVAREDIGRHNAVDKVIGWAVMNDRVPLDRTILMLSGRAGFEIVQKALVAGIPVLACVSGASDLAAKLAREFGMTLIGFLRSRRFVIYSGVHRVVT